MALVAVEDQEEFFDVGFKFKPTDVEILDHYVRRRFSGFPEPNFLIKSEDVYAYKPWNLQKLHQFPHSREMYFFTLRRPASKKRVSRTVDEGGKWDCKLAEKAIYKQEVRNDKKVNVLVGYRNQLSFKDADKGKMHDQWIMHEYRVDELVLGFKSEIQDKLVFCKIYKKKELEEEEEERCAKRQRMCDNEAAVAVAASADGNVSTDSPTFGPMKSLKKYESTANGIPPPAAETSSSSQWMISPILQSMEGALNEASSSSPIPLAAFPAVDYSASYSNYLLEDHIQYPEFDPMISLDDLEFSADALALPAAETSPSMCIVSPISRSMDGTHDDHEFAASADDDSAFYAKLSEDFNASHHEIAKLLEDNPSDAVAFDPLARDFTPVDPFDDFIANADYNWDDIVTSFG